MADTAGQNPTNDKQRQPYFGERRVKVGNVAADKRKLRDMMRSTRPKKGKEL